MRVSLRFDVKESQSGNNKMANMECAVCQCDMGVLQYKHSDADTNETDSVVRLRCGHAFHGNCIALALRSTGSCPMCRDGDNREGDNRIQITLNDLYDSFYDISSALNILHGIRNRKSVQDSRHELNIQKRAFHEKVALMQSDRKRILRDALRDFRSKHRDSFDRIKNNYQKALSATRSAEYNALLELGEETANETLVILDANGVYSVRHKHADLAPFRNSFWK